MFAWTINDIYLIISAFLLILTGLLLASRRNYLIWQFALATISLSVWNLCVYILDSRLILDYVSLVDRVQLSAILLFGTGLFNFCSSFPDNRTNHWQAATAMVSSVFILALLFTRQISDAVYEADGVRYIEGLGFALYALYICVLAFLIFAFLFSAWRNYPLLRSKTRFFIAGVSCFVFLGSLFNAVLPAFGHYEFLMIGRLSSTISALMFFYAIAKHEFLDVTVIINKSVAWVVTLLIMCGLSLLAYQLAANHPLLENLALLATSISAAVFARPFQQFLLTTAKRKFIKGWYEPDEVFRRLGSSITHESSREAIFRFTLNTLDEVFELEDTLSIVAVREQMKLSGYRVQRNLLSLTPSEPLLMACKEKYSAMLLEDIDGASLQQLNELMPKLRDKAVLIPFHSPEYLEGVLVLGPKSSGAGFNDSDMLFFSNLISYLSPVLYRLTPIETLERLYNENQKKLHDAEIQLLRAQKIESIIHATRQCHHEIRTPLNIIKLGIGRIKTLEDLENYKLIAKEEINHAIEIVEETLSISDVSQPSTRSLVNINVNDVITRCLRLIDRSRYQVAMDLMPESPIVKGISSDIQVVITNLIHNALEAMPEGGTLSFSTKIVDSNIQIRVEDTGAGIAPEIRSRVWEPYFSGKGGSVGNSNAGRGWGLTIVNRIINEHAGTIHLSSEVGVGTCFVILLPSANALSAASDAVPAAIHA